MSEFFHMGGHGFYIWTSYLITLIVLVLNVLLPHYREQNTIKTLKRKARRAHREQPIHHPDPQA